MESPGIFRIGQPPEGWKLTRNVQRGSSRLVAWKREGEDVDLRVSSQRIEDDARRVPLAMLAEAVVTSFGRDEGIETFVDAIQRVDFGRHEAIVVHAVRLWRGPPDDRTPLVAAPDPGAKKKKRTSDPIGIEVNAIDLRPKPRATPRPAHVSRRMTQGFVRSGNTLVVVSYLAPEDLFERYAPDFAFALERFAVLLPPDPPEMGVALPGDLPETIEGSAGPLPVTTPPPE